MEISNVESFRWALESEIARHASRPVRLLTTSDVAMWASENGINLIGNPVASSFAECGGDGRLIVLRSEIAGDRINGVLARLDLGGHWNETRAFRDDPLRFLRHLVLHELAHLENNWDQSHEDDCDIWAFEKLLA